MGYTKQVLLEREYAKSVFEDPNVSQFLSEMNKYESEEENN